MMGRLIDADKLKRKCQKVATEAWKMKIKASAETIMNQFIDFIDEADAVDAVPVRHGRWETDGIMMDECEFLMTRCTACGGTYEYGFNMPFCPNCGARMDGEDGEHETD